MNRSEQVQAILWLDQVAEAAKAKAFDLRADLASDARAEYITAGTAPTWRIPDVATVSASVSKDSVVVDDEKAFMRWVAERYPHEIEEIVQVRPSWRAAFLGNTATDGESVADPATGEVVPGLKVRPGGTLTGVSIRVNSTAKSLFGAVARQALLELAASAGPSVPKVLAELEAGHADA